MLLLFCLLKHHSIYFNHEIQEDARFLQAVINLTTENNVLMYLSIPDEILGII